MREARYILWCIFHGHWDCNALPPGLRYVGPSKDWHDAPIYCFGFWWSHIYVGAAIHS